MRIRLAELTELKLCPGRHKSFEILFPDTSTQRPTSPRYNISAHVHARNTRYEGGRGAGCKRVAADAGVKAPG